MIFVGVIISLLWILPLVARLEEKKIGTVKFVLCFLLGAFPVFFICYFAKEQLDTYIENIALKAIYRDLIVSFLAGGILSELLIFIFSWIITNAIRVPRKIDYILIFGMVGLGYEILDNLMTSVEIFEIIIKSIVALSIFAQLHMGAKFFDFRFNRKKFYKIFFLPMVGHGLYDSAITLYKYALAKQYILTNSKYYGMIAIVGIVLISSLIYIAFVYRMAQKEIDFENEYTAMNSSD